MTVSNTDTTTEFNPEEPGNALPRMGEILREKREEKNLTVEDISNRLRLSVRQIQALEANNFAIFTEPMMTRGFIRNYARFLEIDPEPLLQAYRAYVPSESPHSLSLHSANVQLPINGQRSWGKQIALLVIVALLVAGWVFYEEYLPHPDVVATPAPVAETSSEATPDSEPMPEPALPIAERENQGETNAVGVEEGSAPATVAPVKPTDAAKLGSSQVEAIDQAKPLEAQPQESNVKLKQETAGQLLKLKLAFTEESWVSVTDKDGNQVFNKTKPAGSRDTVEARPPVKVVLGNAAGSQVFYQDKAIDLAPYTRLNVARLTLSLE